MIRRFAKISALLIVFLIITGTTAYLTLTFIIKSEDTVVVPDLLGKGCRLFTGGADGSRTQHQDKRVRVQ